MDRTKGKHGTHMTACIAVLLAAALLLGGCGTAVPAPTPAPTPTEAPTQALTPMPTQAPTQKPTATPVPTSRVLEIVVSVDADLEAYSTENYDFELKYGGETESGSLFEITINGKRVGVRFICGEETILYVSGSDITDEDTVTAYIAGAGALLHALLPNQFADFFEASDAYMQWFFDPYISSSEMVEKQIGGCQFLYGWTSDIGWMLWITY